MPASTQAVCHQAHLPSHPRLHSCAPELLLPPPLLVLRSLLAWLPVRSRVLVREYIANAFARLTLRFSATLDNWGENVKTRKGGRALAPPPPKKRDNSNFLLVAQTIFFFRSGRAYPLMSDPTLSCVLLLPSLCANVCFAPNFPLLDEIAHSLNPQQVRFRAVAGQEWF